MLYTVSLDENNFIMSVGHTLADDTDLNLDQLDLQYLSAYQLIDGQPILNQEKLAELQAEENQFEKNVEIAELEQHLTDTEDVLSEMLEELLSLDNAVTFISDFIKVLKRYRSTYKDILAQRAAWRARIRELQG